VRRRTLLPVLLAAGLYAIGAGPRLGAGADALTPGTRVLLDAHNAYPYDGKWADRIDRALATGLPLAIEQDLVWYTDPKTGVARSIVAHGEPFTGTEPTLRDYFFERIRPLVEAALQRGSTADWPIVTLNLDFKSDEPAHHQAIWDLLGDYESWLCTAVRSADGTVQPMQVGPVLVLTGDQDAQQVDFHDHVPVGETLRLFGAVHALESGMPMAKTNYRRWWNNPWKVVEPEGQPTAGAWTAADAARLTTAVTSAHDAGLWIRFYTLNGHAPEDAAGGWSAGYNFGSEAAARERWRAAIAAGVDFVATDQYELFARVLHDGRP
jgi:hypothetical protein